MSKLNKHHGGPAFPRPASLDPEFNARMPSQSGMTLRDYFAAKAMQGILARPGSVTPREDAAMAYLMADAMLTERGRE